MARPRLADQNKLRESPLVQPELILLDSGSPFGDLTVTAAAQALGVTRATLSNFLNEHSTLTPDMTVRIDKAFGVSMDTLMQMQNSYDIAQAHKREEINVSRYKPKRGRTQ